MRRLLAPALALVAAVLFQTSTAAAAEPAHGAHAAHAAPAHGHAKPAANAHAKAHGKAHGKAHEARVPKARPHAAKPAVTKTHGHAAPARKHGSVAKAHTTPARKRH